MANYEKEIDVFVFTKKRNKCLYGRIVEKIWRLHSCKSY